MMQNTELLTIADGGIQTVIPEPTTMSPQIIYLDFDGELTSYHNHDLDIHIDDVAVEDSGLTQERIASIIKALNDDFADQNVIFVTERPNDTEFSTIYVGKTSSFDDYGNFAGLAETVDIDNQIKNDNAFVMLDETADDSAIIETISHEAQHLIGTLEHWGDGISRYTEGGYIYYYCLNNQTLMGTIIDGSDFFTYPYDGKGLLVLSRNSIGKEILFSSSHSSNGNVSSCVGTGYVSAHNTTINDGGVMYVSSGGVANNTTVNSGGSIYVGKGGVANNTTVNSDVNIYVGKGGVANNTTVNSDGWLEVDSGGTATGVTLKSGGRLSFAIDGDADTYVQGTFNGISFEMKDGCLSRYTINGAGYTVINGGIVNSTTVVNGALNISSGMANSTIVNSNGRMNVSSGGMANSTIVNSNGRMNVSSGGMVNSTVVSSSGSFYVYSNGTASNTTIDSNGWMCVNSEGSANSTTVRSSGSMTVVGFASNTDILGGTQTINSGSAENVDIHSNGRQYVSFGQVRHTSIYDGGRQIICSDGLAEDTIVQHEGKLLVTDFGEAKHVTVSSNGQAYVLTLAEMQDITVQTGGGLWVGMAGFAEDITIQGAVHVATGGEVKNATIAQGGHLYLYGGAILDGVINVRGTMTIDETDQNNGFSLRGDTTNDNRSSHSGAAVSAMNATINLIVDGAPSVFGEEQHNGYITNLNALTDAGLNITVTENATGGTYLLAGDAEGYHFNITLSVNDMGGGYQFVWDDELDSYRQIAIGNAVYSLSIQNDDEFTGLYLTIDNQEAFNGAYEYIARRLAYEDGHKDYKVGDPIDFTISVSGKQYDYHFIVRGIYDDPTTYIYIPTPIGIVPFVYHLGGFDAILLERTDATGESMHQAILACGGTEQKISDGLSDINDKGIGYNQFDDNADKVYAACKELVDQGCTLSMTGHSLGGALAQWFAAYSKERGHIDTIGSLVTFNSPGISTAATNTNAQINTIRHFVNDGDIVSLAGEGYVGNSNATYTLFATPFVCANKPHSYILMQHSNTLFFLDTLQKDDGTVLHKNISLGEITSNAPVYSLEADNFSYLAISTDNTSIVKDLSHVFDFVQNPSGGYWLFNKQYMKVIDICVDGNAEVANQFVNRHSAENSRIHTTYSIFKLALNTKFSNFWKVDARTVELGKQNLVSTLAANTDSVIRTVTIADSGKAQKPQYLFDFEQQNFIQLYYAIGSYLVVNSVSQFPDILEVSFYITNAPWSDDGDVWACIKAPSFNGEYSRYTLTEVLNARNEVISTSNYMKVGNDTYIIDDSATSYVFRYTIDTSIRQERGGININIASIEQDTSQMQIVITDIDASSSQGTGADFITVEVKTESGNASTTVQLQQTGVEGIFTGTIDLQDNDDFAVTPGENLIISYIDNDNGNGQREVVSQAIPVLQTDTVFTIDEKGLEADYTAISEDAAWYKYNVLVDSNTLAGSYVLAENLGNASGNCVIWGSDSETNAALAADEGVTIDANTYSKQIIDDKLVLNVKTAPRTIHWEELEEVYGYIIEFSQDHFESVIQLIHLDQAQTQMDLLNLPNGEYDYRIRALENYDELMDEGLVIPSEDDEWIFAGTITVKNNVVAERRVADDGEEKPSFFFGNARSVWSENYQAKHVGTGEWQGTGQTVKLAGKNAITDIFDGAGIDSFLFLTDDANGDALFIDDIYSAFPEGLDHQSRFAEIGEISAGAGDDLIDLTSQRFDYMGNGMVVHGGLGDDVIWANNVGNDYLCANEGYNWLFGDEGNDWIIGGSDWDVIAGGSGDDTLHGGGGDDIFCFGGDWGHDTVEQLADGKVTLWFDEGDLSKWDEKTLTYRDGDNSVKVSGVGVKDITLKFSYGDYDPELAFMDGVVQYGYLSGIGAFDDYTTKKVFEDRNRGMLA